MTTMIGDGLTVEPPRDKIQAVWRGFLGRCPNCGKGHMFRAYLKVNDRCPVCHEELYHQRADDAPPYVTMFIVAHVVVALLLSVEAVWVDAPFWLEAVIFSIVTVLLSLVILPRVKGALVALQWSLRMHGFSSTTDHIDRSAPVL
jgi:uncharacterized protein (DUF983 family)